MIINQIRINRIFSIIIAIIIFCGCSNSIQNNNSDNIINEKVSDLIGQMTLDEKIGQMTQVDRQFLKSEQDIKDYFLGSLLSGGGSTPETNNPVEWANMVDGYQSIALETRLSIPIIYGIDAVHGHNNVVGAVIFPHNIGLGCVQNSDLIQQASQITAKEVRATGIHWTFSPCVTVPLDDRWGRQYEGYSESPQVVKKLSKYSVLGYQGENLGSDNTSILACAKHFIGDGGVMWGTGFNGLIDRGNTQIDEQKLRDVHLPGYISAIEADVGSIMISYSSFNGEKLHGHKELITGLLKEELGFKGIIVSDWAGIGEIPGDDKSDIEIAINAGLDMIMVPEHYIEFLANLKSLVLDNRIPMSRIDNAVSRILRIKLKLGLFDQPFAERSLLTEIGSNDHREIAEECVRQSLVLLKNENNILPISKDIKKLYVVGRSADNIGIQCGGWSISWQGSPGQITTGTTILDGIKSTVGANTEVVYSPTGSGIDDADKVILVVGEDPYAEMEGDRESLLLDPRDQVAVERVRQSDIPTVTVVISGRPLIITDHLAYWDALAAAWLPGTEGQGVVDVLFGDYNPTAKLSYSWPKAMEDIPINVGDADYDPLFPFDFGLSY